MCETPLVKEKLGYGRWARCQTFWPAKVGHFGRMISREQSAKAQDHLSDRSPAPVALLRRANSLETSEVADGGLTVPGTGSVRGR
jgi:hypothetical protein